MRPAGRPDPASDSPATAARLDAGGAATRERWRGRGFGVDLDSEYDLVGLPAGWGTGGRSATHLLVDEHIDEPAGGRRLREVRYGHGGLAMAIDDHGAHGLRIDAPDFGAHLVSSDGASVRSRPREGLPPWRWQRLLSGQVLPLVAALRGLEVLHASAACVEGMAFALSGDSGAGKSALVAQLALRGHRLVTDDVLAVSLADGQPLAHPGNHAMALRPADGDLVARLIDAGIGTPIGSDDKCHVRLSGADQPMALRALFLLRTDDATAPPIVAAQPSLPELMHASYVKYVRSPERLRAQFEVQAAIARACPILAVNVRASLAPDELAVLLEQEMVALARGGDW